MRRNCLFLVVSLLDPSILTTYLSLSPTAMTVPVLPHLVGLLPDWFWTRHTSPITKGGNILEPESSLSTCLPSL